MSSVFYGQDTCDKILNQASIKDGFGESSIEQMSRFMDLFT